MTSNTTNNSNLMPIGRFSNACRLSIKALRHYDERGLLVPAFVDSETGYRYYRDDQSRDAVMIALLRSLDVPLETIKRVLHAQGDELRTCLDQERARIEQDLARKAHALRSIQRIANHGDLMPYSVAIRTAPDYRVAAIECATTATNMIEDSGKLMYALFETLERLGKTLCDPYMCINGAPDPLGKIVVLACVGIEENEIADEQVKVIDVKGGPEAWLTHTGAYEELGLAYHTLAAWVQARGHQQRDSLREIYLNDPADTPVDELTTEVILPLSL